MKSIINGLIITVDMFSEIPMPKVERNRQNMKYTLCFFPTIGLLIGALLYGWCEACIACGFGQTCFALVGAVIPVLVTGGIHLSGFMNTVDMLQTYEKKERNPEIIKDPCVGAIAVIGGICYCLLYSAGLVLIWKKEQLLLLGLSYMISRTLSGMSIVWFQPAKKEGTLFSLSTMAHRKAVRIVLVTILALCFISGIIINPIIGAVMALLAMWVWTYYYYMSLKKFGGITGDLAGYFLCLCELSSVLLIGGVGRVM